MERQQTPDEVEPRKMYHQVYVTIELSVMSDDEESAEMDGWKEVEEVAKKNHWNVVSSEYQQP